MAGRLDSYRGQSRRASYNIVCITTHFAPWTRENAGARSNAIETPRTSHHVNKRLHPWVAAASFASLEPRGEPESRNRVPSTKLRRRAATVAGISAMMCRGRLVAIHEHVHYYCSGVYGLASPMSLRLPQTKRATLLRFSMAPYTVPVPKRRDRERNPRGFQASFLRFFSEGTLLLCLRRGNLTLCSCAIQQLARLLGHSVTDYVNIVTSTCRPCLQYGFLPSYNC